MGYNDALRTRNGPSKVFILKNSWSTQWWALAGCAVCMLTRSHCPGRSARRQLRARMMPGTAACTCLVDLCSARVQIPASHHHEWHCLQRSYLTRRHRGVRGYAYLRADCPDSPWGALNMYSFPNALAVMGSPLASSMGGTRRLSG